MVVSPQAIRFLIARLHENSYCTATSPTPPRKIIVQVNDSAQNGHNLARRVIEIFVEPLVALVVTVVLVTVIWVVLLVPLMRGSSTSSTSTGN